MVGMTGFKPVRTDSASAALYHTHHSISPLRAWYWSLSYTPKKEHSIKSINFPRYYPKDFVSLDFTDINQLCTFCISTKDRRNMVGLVRKLLRTLLYSLNKQKCFDNSFNCLWGFRLFKSHKWLLNGLTFLPLLLGVLTIPFPKFSYFGTDVLAQLGLCRYNWQVDTGIINLIVHCFWNKRGNNWKKTIVIVSANWNFPLISIFYNCRVYIIFFF